MSQIYRLNSLEYTRFSVGTYLLVILLMAKTIIKVVVVVLPVLLQINF